MSRNMYWQDLLDSNASHILPYSTTISALVQKLRAMLNHVSLLYSFIVGPSNAQ